VQQQRREKIDGRTQEYKYEGNGNLEKGRLINGSGTPTTSVVLSRPRRRAADAERSAPVRPAEANSGNGLAQSGVDRGVPLVGRTRSHAFQVRGVSPLLIDVFSRSRTDFFSQRYSIVLTGFSCEIFVFVSMPWNAFLIAKQRLDRLLGSQGVHHMPQWTVVDVIASESICQAAGFTSPRLCCPNATTPRKLDMSQILMLPTYDRPVGVASWTRE
jgi:hypothetical protein